MFLILTYRMIALPLSLLLGSASELILLGPLFYSPSTFTETRGVSYSFKKLLLTFYKSLNFDSKSFKYSLQSYQYYTTLQYRQ